MNGWFNRGNFGQCKEVWPYARYIINDSAKYILLDLLNLLLYYAKHKIVCCQIVYLRFTTFGVGIFKQPWIWYCTDPVFCKLWINSEGNKQGCLFYSDRYIRLIATNVLSSFQRQRVNQQVGVLTILIPTSMWQIPIKFPDTCNDRYDHRLTNLKIL